MGVGDPRKQIAHQCQPPAALIVEVDDRPGRMIGVGRLQHRLARLGVIIVFLARGEIDGGQLPALQRVLQPFAQALFLLRLIGRQPVFEQQDAVIDEQFLEGGHGLEEGIHLRV